MDSNSPSARVLVNHFARVRYIEGSSHLKKFPQSIFIVVPIPVGTILRMQNGLQAVAIDQGDHLRQNFSDTVHKMWEMKLACAFDKRTEVQIPTGNFPLMAVGFQVDV